MSYSFTSMKRCSSYVVPALVATLAFAPSAIAQEAVAQVESQLDSAADVTLTADGMLIGQIVDAQGRPKADVPLLLHRGVGDPTPSTTNQRGHFAYRGVAAGVYFLEANNRVRIVRVWGNESAPPSATTGVLMVAGDDAMSGQYGPPGAANTVVQKTKRVLANPLAVAGIIATAVAIPVAVHNSDDGS